MKDQRNILIVEDDQECGKLLCEVVRRMGLNYLLARNILEAARVLAQHKVHLVILDRGLGKGADGLTLCLALKKNLHTRPIPVIVLTGLSGPDEECKGYRFGADLYLRKPFSVLKLTRYVKTFLARLPYKDEIKDRIVYGNIALDRGSRTLTIGSWTYDDLPVRQFDFMALLAFRRGRAVSRAYLVKKLWGDQVRDKEVDTIVYRLKRRLGPITGACIVPVRSYGYRLRPFLDASSGPAEYPRPDDGVLDARMVSSTED